MLKPERRAKATAYPPYRALAAAVVLICSAGAPIMRCQSQSPGTGILRFEVGSVKPAPVPPVRGGGGSSVDPQRWTAGNRTLKQLIMMSHGVRYFQIVAGPDWADSARYDVAGKSETPTTREQLLQMVQTLLTERFKLALHRETREMKVYAMLLGKNGPKFQESREGSICAECRMRGTSPLGLADLLTSLLSLPSHDPATGALVANGNLPVVDQTGLKGFYDIAFHQTDGGDVFIDIQQQLGLKLEVRRMPMELLVIDHAEKPSEN